MLLEAGEAQEPVRVLALKVKAFISPGWTLGRFFKRSVGDFIFSGQA